jgi:hypothetical protein
VDRLRSLSQARLLAAAPPYDSLAAGARALAERLAATAAGIAERGSAEPPHRRPLPRLSEFAVGDQVAVTGKDLLAACGGVADTDLVWCDGRRRRTAEAIAEALVSVTELRRRL